MPKTKTSNKRASARSKASTSTSKKKGLFARLNLSSKKNQFIAVVLSVAVMGGGWFTVRSFAASPPLYSLGPSAFMCTPKYPTLQGPEGCKITTERDASKNVIGVIHIFSDYDFPVRPFSEFRSKAGYTFESNKKYEFCVTAKGSGRLLATLFDHNVANAITYTFQGVLSNQDINSPNKFKTYCKTPQMGDLLPGKNNKIINVISKGNSLISISNIAIYPAGGAPPPLK